MDAVIGTKFEHIISDLYKTMGYNAIKTPDTNDNGADVVGIDTIKKVSSNRVQYRNTHQMLKEIGKDNCREFKK